MSSKTRHHLSAAVPVNWNFDVAEICFFIALKKKKNLLENIVSRAYCVAGMHTSTLCCVNLAAYHFHASLKRLNSILATHFQSILQVTAESTWKMKGMMTHIMSQPRALRSRLPLHFCLKQSREPIM